ncbi:hypothetical protein Tco_0645253 [Tanacetum coccineum]
MHDFESRLGRIYDRQVHRIQVLDFDVLTEDIDHDLTERLRIEHTNAEGKVLFTSYVWRALLGLSMNHWLAHLGFEREMETHGFGAYWADSLRVIAFKAKLADYWVRISSSGDFLSIVPSYTMIKEPLRRLCHRLIMFTITGRGQAPEKVTTTDLFYLRSMDERTTVNVPYLLAHYLFKNASGRKQGARMAGGHKSACRETTYNVFSILLSSLSSQVIDIAYPIQWIWRIDLT